MSPGSPRYVARIAASRPLGVAMILFGRVAGLILVLLFPVLQTSAAENSAPDPFAWPPPTRECRPWTRWWWLGSAVDTTNLTRLLTEYHQAGIGGVEICPIYGAKGYEDRFIDFLSPRWVKMLEHTTREAARLSMGVDLTTGTGWPFGGPRVSEEDASSRVVLKRYDLNSGQRLEASLPEGRLQCLVAISDDGRQTNLTASVAGDRLDWTAPSGQWRLYAVAQNGPIQKVKRAAPGGEGSVLDPFSPAAMDHYLADFDSHLAGFRGPMPRAEFHDSYEYYGAQWTANFFGEFQTRRGYDLRWQLPALFKEGDEDTIARVRSDYRETISDLHLAYIRHWTSWAHGHGSLSRDQAHGSPANLLDVYAASDIPETEIFGATDEKNVPLNKFSTSAAHVAGRNLASSESFTWLTEHFQASLSDVKQAADYLFLVGVNHIFFHGIPYSPADALWPGWQFYASVNFGPQGGLWHDLPEFNDYVTRCQSMLQSGAPDNDVLLYFPVFDLWQSSGNLIIPNPSPPEFTGAAMTLWNRGYAFDHISDRFIEEAACHAGNIVLPGGSYRAVVVPSCRVMPESTFRSLIELARSGAMVIFQGELPADVAGLGNLKKRRADFAKDQQAIKFSAKSDETIRRATVGKGAFLEGNDLNALLQAAHVKREPAVDLGLRFVRRADSEGHIYFLANRSSKAVDGFVPLATSAKAAVLMDPRFGDRAGLAVLRVSPAGETQVYLQLQPGESCFLRTFRKQSVRGPTWEYVENSGNAWTLTGAWRIQFIDGGPVLPPACETQDLGSWTKLEGNDVKRFSGTARYTLEFDRPDAIADDWLLDLGSVGDSARVKLNGHDAIPAWCEPFRLRVGELLRPGGNKLEVEVTNLAANRIADLDRRHVNWKYFYDANVAAHRSPGRLLDASNWPLRDSGLLGPVRLQPLKKLAFHEM